jgi:hypothetical protein
MDFLRNNTLRAKPFAHSAVLFVTEYLEDGVSMNTRTIKTAVLSLLMLAMVSASIPFMPSAEAHGRGRYRGWNNDNRWDDNWNNGNRGRYYENNSAWKTRELMKGAAVGGGLGAGYAVLTDRPVLKPAVAGAVIGAAVQALRY